MGGQSSTPAVRALALACPRTPHCHPAGVPNPRQEGFVTVSSRRDEREEVDEDLAALRSLSTAPLLKPQSFGSLLLTGHSEPDLPALHPHNLSALCHELASRSRAAAAPMCEEQKALTTQMASVEALCARALYVVAIRASEASSSAAALRELPDLAARLRETKDAVRRCVERADALQALLPPEEAVAAARGPRGEG